MSVNMVPVMRNVDTESEQVLVGKRAVKSKVKMRTLSSKSDIAASSSGFRTENRNGKLASGMDSNRVAKSSQVKKSKKTVNFEADVSCSSSDTSDTDQDRMNEYRGCSTVAPVMMTDLRSM